MVCINIIILQDHIIGSAEHNPNQVSFRYQSDMEGDTIASNAANRMVQPNRQPGQYSSTKYLGQTQVRN